MTRDASLARRPARRAALPHAAPLPIPTEFRAQPSRPCSSQPREAELLLIRRAEHPSDPWSGHMALPGGRNDPQDTSLYETVVRECAKRSASSSRATPCSASSTTSAR
jgi:8-oxo-dGTP pyrophosphatase MutT (NUDIX family)